MSGRKIGQNKKYVPLVVKLVYFSLQLKSNMYSNNLINLSTTLMFTLFPEYIEKKCFLYESRTFTIYDFWNVLRCNFIIIVYLIVNN